MMFPKPTLPVPGTEDPPDGILHVLVSQTVDDGVQEGGQDDEGDCRGCVPEHRVCGREAQVHYGHAAEEQQKYGKVRGTRGEGSVATFSRGHAQDDHNDAGVGQ